LILPWHGRVRFPDTHSQAAAASQQLFGSPQSSIGMDVPTYIFKALSFLWMLVSPPISPAREGEDAPGAASIPRLDRDPHEGGRIRPAQRRGLRLAARSEQWSRCHRLTNHGRNPGSHLHPIPGQDFCAALGAAGPSQPQPHRGRHQGETEVWPLPGWAGRNHSFPPKNKIFWEVSVAPGLPPVPPATLRHGHGARDGQRRQLQRQPVPLNRYTSLP